MASKDDTIDKVLSANRSLQTLSDALRTADLMKLLASNEYTIFAPTNKAFAMVPPRDFQDLLRNENREILKELLKYHIVPRIIKSKDFVNGEKIKTLNAKTLNLVATGTKFFVNDGEDDGFAAVVSPDIEASNGVIHTIERVLLPPGFTKPKPYKPPPTLNALELIERVGSTSTFLEAIKLADLTELLTSKGPITVFVPSNAAFDNLADDFWEDLMKKKNKKKLKQLLKFHIAPGEVNVDNIKSGNPIETELNKETLLPLVTPGVTELASVYIEGFERGNFARITGADLDATNGVVQIVDGVLFPESVNPKDSIRSHSPSPEQKK